MTIGERISLLRKSLGLNQEEFGKRINVTRSAVSNYEKGLRNIMDRVISDICREFYVNEEWLRNGEGLMFKEEDTFSLDDYLIQNNCTEKEMLIITSFIKAYMKFPVELRDAFIEEVISDFKSNKCISNGNIHDVDFIEEPKEKK